MLEGSTRRAIWNQISEMQERDWHYRTCGVEAEKLQPLHDEIDRLTAIVTEP